MAQVQLTTDVKSFKGYTQTAANALVQRIASTTRPTDGTGSTVIGGGQNYMKFRFFNSDSTTPAIYIYGWSFASDTMSWEPQLLFSSSTTLTSGTHSHPQFGTVYEVANYTKVTGDAKIFPGPANSGNAGFILVDTLGCQFIDIHCVASGSTTSFTAASL